MTSQAESIDDVRWHNIQQGNVVHASCVAAVSTVKCCKMHHTMLQLPNPAGTSPQIGKEYHCSVYCTKPNVSLVHTSCSQSTVQCTAAQFVTMQCSAMQCNHAMHYSPIPTQHLRRPLQSTVLQNVCTMYCTTYCTTCIQCTAECMYNVPHDVCGFCTAAHFPHQHSTQPERRTMSSSPLTSTAFRAPCTSISGG